MSCYCDYDQPDFYRVEERTAAKDHRCYECNCKIRKGALYYSITGKWDGEIRTYKTCERCWDLWESLKEGIGCVYHGGLSEIYTEYLYEIGRPELAKGVLPCK